MKPNGEALQNLGTTKPDGKRTHSNWQNEAKGDKSSTGDLAERSQISDGSDRGLAERSHHCWRIKETY
jgi:hypothetical protein